LKRFYVISLRRVAPLIAAAATLSMLAVACGGDSNKTASSSSSASQQSIDDLTSRVQRDEMLDAWIAIAAIPVHDLDQTLQGGKIDGKYVPALRTLIRELALTEFSPAVKPAAQQLHDDAAQLYQAMNSGQEPAQLQAMSATVHSEYDKFSPTLGNEVAKDLPANAGGPSGSSTTPSAGSTGAQ
jgi:hypothetical protein